MHTDMRHRQFEVRLRARWGAPLLLVSALLLPAWAAKGDDASETKSKPVSYYRDVRPIFVQHCQGCHQPAIPRGQYVMTDFAHLVKAGDSGDAAVVAGKPDDSALVWQIEPLDGKPPAMPKGADPLPDHVVKTIRTWIAEGAVDDTPASAKETIDADHPPHYIDLPVVTSLAISPDGKLLAVSGYHEVLLYENGTDKLVGRLIGLAEQIQSLAFSPDGTKLAVTGGSPGRFGEVQVWDVASKKLLRSIPLTHDTVFGASWAKDSKRLSIGCADNTLRVFDVNSGEQVLFQGAHNDWVLDTRFSTDDSHLVSVSRDMSLKLTEVATQRFVDNITSITPGALKGGLMAVDRHPGRDELLIGGADGIPKVYRMYRTQARKIGDDFNHIRSFDPLPGRVFDVTYSPNGDRLAAGSSSNGKGAARIYETDTGKTICDIEGITQPIYAVVFSPDGKTLVTAGFDGMIRTSDAATGKLLRQMPAVPLSAGVPHAQLAPSATPSPQPTPTPNLPEASSAQNKK